MPAECLCRPKLGAHSFRNTSSHALYPRPCQSVELKRGVSRTSHLILQHAWFSSSLPPAALPRVSFGSPVGSHPRSDRAAALWPESPNGCRRHRTAPVPASQETFARVLVQLCMTLRAITPSNTACGCVAVSGVQEYNGVFSGSGVHIDARPSGYPSV